MATHIEKSKKDNTSLPIFSEEILEQLLGDENLIAQEGEQKYYVLSNKIALEKIMESIPAVASGEFSQSRRWHRTSVEVDKEEQQFWTKVADHLQAMDERLQRIESLLHVALYSGKK
ncbi:MAG: hypothetical protein K0R78_326 [Pelosinus sp.]|jgi:hypothetical protein|nr:hypothetical protein [Pelosinus sp.]